MPIFHRLFPKFLDAAAALPRSGLVGAMMDVGRRPIHRCNSARRDWKYSHYSFAKAFLGLHFTDSVTVVVFVRIAPSSRRVYARLHWTGGRIPSGAVQHARYGADCNGSKAPQALAVQARRRCCPKRTRKLEAASSRMSTRPTCHEHDSLTAARSPPLSPLPPSHHILCAGTPRTRLASSPAPSQSLNPARAAYPLPRSPASILPRSCAPSGR